MKIKPLTPASLILILAIVLSQACNKNDDNDFNKYASEHLKHLSITDANSLVIASQSTQTTTKSATLTHTENQNVLYKITDNGLIVEVNYHDEKGNLLNQEYNFQPIDIKTLNENFILLCYLTEADPSGNVHKFIVRKSDGAVFSAPLGNAWEADNYYLPSDQNIGNQNMYFIGVKHLDNGSGYEPLNQLIIDNNGDLFFTQVSIDEENVSHFFVDKQDNYIYGSGPYRIISSQGSINKVTDINPIIVGPEGKIYSFEEGSIYRLSVLPDATIEKEFIDSYDENISWVREPFSRFVRFGDKQVYFSYMGEVATFFENGKVLSVFKPVEGLLAGRISFRPFENPDYYNGSLRLLTAENYYFMAGYQNLTLKIYRIDIQTHTAIEFPFDFSPYEIRLGSITVVNDNELIFSGLRKNDAAWVNYAVNIDGTTELLDLSERKVEIIQLERLN